MYFFSLMRVRLNKKEEVKRLNNLSSNYPSLFYKEQAKDVDVDLPSVVAQQIVAESQLLTDDVKNFLLGTSEYANDIQSDIDLFVAKGRFNERRGKY